jgi:predicted secreted protein
MLIKFHSYINPYDTPAPDINHFVDAILIAVAIPPAANVRVAVVSPDGIQTIVSVVIVIDKTPEPVSLINVSTVPIGNATDEFAGIVYV